MFSSKFLVLSVLVIALGLYGPLSTSFFKVAKADSLIGFIHVGLTPIGVAFDSANGDIYVVNSRFPDSTVSVIDGSTNNVIKTIPITHSEANNVVFDSANGDIYVSGVNPDTIDDITCCQAIVSVIDGLTNNVIKTIVVDDSVSGGMAFDSANGDIYLGGGCGVNGNPVSVISGQTNTVVKTITGFPTNGCPDDVAFDSANGKLYVTMPLSNAVSVIDGSTNNVIATVPVGLSPRGVAFDPANGDLYVANSGFDNNVGTIGEGSVSVIDGSTNNVITTLPTGWKDSRGIAFDSANRDIYVTNFFSDTVSVIDGSTNTVTGYIDGELNFAGPNGIAFDPANGNLYVTDTEGQPTGFVNVISTIPDTTPPDTVITSDIDGNGASIPPGGTTLSTSMRISFTGTDNVAVDGFQCSLDGQAFSNCISPVTLNNLAAGTTHTFQVRAVDTANNVDPTPGTLSWTILTPAQGIQQLIHVIQTMGLNQGTQTSLIAHLNSALAALSSNNNNPNSATTAAAGLSSNNNNPNNVKTACNILGAFTNEVNTQVQSGHITTSQSSQLIRSGQAIEEALSC
jgi:YVTN family beta-propeller protein